MDRQGCWSIARGVCSQWPNLNLIFPSYLERWLQMVLPISEGASAYLEIAQQNEHLFFIGCFSLCQDSIYTRILYLYMLCYHRAAMPMCARSFYWLTGIRGYHHDCSELLQYCHNQLPKARVSVPNRRWTELYQAWQNMPRWTSAFTLSLCHTDRSLKKKLLVSWSLLTPSACMATTVIWKSATQTAISGICESEVASSMSKAGHRDRMWARYTSPVLPAVIRNQSTNIALKILEQTTRPARFNQCLGFSCFNHWIPIQWQLPQVWYRAKRPKSLALDAENRKDKASLHKCKLARASWVTMWLCDAKTLWSWGTWKIWHSSTTVTAKGRKVQLLWVDHDEKSHWLARSGRSTCWWMHTRNTCHHVNASAHAMTRSNG